MCTCTLCLLFPLPLSLPCAAAVYGRGLLFSRERPPPRIVPKTGILCRFSFFLYLFVTETASSTSRRSPSWLSSTSPGVLKRSSQGCDQLLVLFSFFFFLFLCLLAVLKLHLSVLSSASSLSLSMAELVFFLLLLRPPFIHMYVRGGVTSFCVFFLLWSSRRLIICSSPR